MKSRVPSRRPRSPQRGAVCATSDIDPEVFFGESRKRKPDHKVRQLCAQVHRSLSVVLPGCRDEAVQGLSVEDVGPFPNGARLLVRVRHWDDDRYSRLELLQRLGHLKGLLRAEVAAAIHRKRTPELLFEVLAPEERLDE